MKISEDIYRALESVLELAEEQLSTIKYEVDNHVQGTMYNCNDVIDAESAIEQVSKFVEKELF